MLAISELPAGSPLTLLTETWEGKPVCVIHSHRTFAPHPKTAQRNGAAGTLEKGMSSLLALPLSFPTHPLLGHSQQPFLFEGQPEILLPGHCHYPTGVSSHLSKSRGTALSGTPRSPRPSKPRLPWQPIVHNLLPGSSLGHTPDRDRQQPGREAIL